MKLRAAGRGRGYSLGRGLLESFLEAAYWGDWPARLWNVLPASREVLVTRHSLTLPAGDGPLCRVVFISDIHVGPTTPLALLQRVFELIRAERPDVLLLGGDYVYLEAEPRRMEVLGSLVRSVGAPVALAVLGNHDLWTRDGAVVEALSNAGARVLVNEAFVFPAPWEDVVVVGVDDPWTGRRDPEAVARGLEAQPFRIVLCHSPDGLGFLTRLKFDLFLAGHTHGGQIATPWGPIVLPHGRMCRAYPSGLARFESGLVYVSRGIGTVELPVRTFSPPDILVLELARPSRRAQEPC